jgi:hypothetical protein
MPSRVVSPSPSNAARRGSRGLNAQPATQSALPASDVPIGGRSALPTRLPGRCSASDAATSCLRPDAESAALRVLGQPPPLATPAQCRVDWLASAQPAMPPLTTPPRCQVDCAVCADSGAAVDGARLDAESGARYVLSPPTMPPLATPARCRVGCIACAQPAMPPRPHDLMPSRLRDAAARGAAVDSARLDAESVAQSVLSANDAAVGDTGAMPSRSLLDCCRPVSLAERAQKHRRCSRLA